MNKKNINFSTIILVGGEGSRFSKLSDPPKHLTKLNKNLILINIMNNLSNSGFKHFIFPLGNKKEYFINFIESKKNQKKFGFKVIRNQASLKDLDSNKSLISYFDAGKKTKKITRIYKSLKFTSLKNFLIVYGDDLANLNFKKIKRIYSSYKGNKVIVSVFKKNSQYGHVKINEKKEVIEFIEKPPHPLPVNIGFYLIEKKILNKFYNKKFELETDFLPILAKKNLLISHEHKGYFYSINDKKELLTAKKNLKNL